MPQMGVSVAEGTIVEWLKRPGDWVEADEVVCVVTTVPFARPWREIA